MHLDSVTIWCRALWNTWFFAEGYVQLLSFNILNKTDCYIWRTF